MTITKQNITAVILAGGKGRRLGGQDKGLVSLNGKALITLILEKIKPQVSTIIINANRNQSTYAKYGYAVVSDDLDDYQGPLAGISSAMKQSQTSHILTLPCDSPYLTDNLVDRMLKSLDNSINNIVVAHDGKRLQSLHALIPVTLVDSLDAFLTNKDRKVGLWHAEHHVNIADFSDIPEAFANINTEEERQKMEKYSNA